MAVDLESPPYRRPRNLSPAPNHSFVENASPFWTIVIAALAAALLVWIIVPSTRTPISVDASAVPMPPVAAPSSVAR